jgi:hypothetical protein
MISLLVVTSSGAASVHRRLDIARRESAHGVITVEVDLSLPQETYGQIFFQYGCGGT